MDLKGILLKRRRELKLSLRKAAKSIGISHSTLFYIEQGKYEPRFSTLMKVLDFYNINLEKNNQENQSNDKRKERFYLQLY